MNVQFSSLSISVPPRASDDIRVGHLIRKKGEVRDPAIALIGVPFDGGVAINGGRVGAASAPFSIREGLYRLTPPHSNVTAFSDLLSATEDWGNLVCGASVEEVQQQLGYVVKECLERKIVPLILGGGHEISFGHFLGYASQRTKVALVNVDAHLDVRPLVGGRAHSGSPFRQALEDQSGSASSYSVIGALRHAVSPEHAEYVLGRGGTIVWEAYGGLEALFEWPVAERVLFSMDIDAIDSAFAPGRSALAPGGIQSSVFLALAEDAGKRREVSSFDLVEVNPLVDYDNRTSRLAGLAIWRFLLGFLSR